MVLLCDGMKFDQYQRGIISICLFFKSLGNVNLRRFNLEMKMNISKFVMAGVILASTGLTGCARPYGPAETVINKQIVQPKIGVEQTKVTITRNKQFLGSGSGGICRYLIQVDGKDIAKLRQNQFITAYLDNGKHLLRVSNECDIATMGMRKSLEVDATGGEQEYLTENGIWGQFLMWRVK